MNLSSLNKKKDDQLKVGSFIPFVEQVAAALARIAVVTPEWGLEGLGVNGFGGGAQGLRWREE